MNRSGFSLLEMLLTLAMSVVLMGLISQAIRFYGREMDGADADFRRVQLATKVLQMIEDDLRMASATRPVDTAPLSDVLSAAAGPLSDLLPPDAASDADSDAATDPPGALGLAQDPLADTTSGASIEIGLLTGTTVLQKPGLIGNATELQVDVSRLPGLESYAIDPALAGTGEAGELLDRPSDIKTVAYFVSDETSVSDPVTRLRQQVTSGGGMSATGSMSTGGLVRRSVDRAISRHAASTGGLARLISNGELIADEVVAIQFEYFDGALWLPQFSSDEAGHLPVAIRVTLTWRNGPGEAGDAGLADRQFSHMIYLPLADREQLADASEPSGASLPPLSEEGI